jgi:hypothetical protein
MEYERKLDALFGRESGQAAAAAKSGAKGTVKTAAKTAGSAKDKPVKGARAKPRKKG